MWSWSHLWASSPNRSQNRNTGLEFGWAEPSYITLIEELGYSTHSRSMRDENDGEYGVQETLRPTPQHRLDSIHLTERWDQSTPSDVPTTPLRETAFSGSSRGSAIGSSGGRRRKKPSLGRHSYSCGQVIRSDSGLSSSSSRHSISDSSLRPASIRRGSSLPSHSVSLASLGPPGVFVETQSRTNAPHPLDAIRKPRRRSGTMRKLVLGSSKRRRTTFNTRDIVWWSSLVFMAFTAMLVGLFLVFCRGTKHIGGLTSRFDNKLQPSISHQDRRWDEEGEWAVFYNVFVPFQSFLAGVDQLIVEEQLDQIGQSYANIGSRSGTLTVYFNTIGNEMDTERIKDLCAIKYDMKCIHMKHYRSATESVTLSQLHHYCSLHPSDSVVYLHNKGSLHPNIKGQDRWRRTMTAAATSELCLEGGLQDRGCNTCGMLFQPLPTNHFPGNMWAAKCKFVKQLLSPDQYHARRPVIDEWIRNQTSMGIWQKYSGLFPLEAHYTGRDRYEAEHWLGSHPSIRPCDVSKPANFDYWLDDDRDFHEFEVRTAPRHNISADWKWYQYASHPEVLTEDTEDHAQQRRRDFFLLRGLLYRSIALYGVLPDTSSWVWDWFPDGTAWLEATKQTEPLQVMQSFANLTGVAEIRMPTSTSHMLLQWIFPRANSWMSVLLSTG